MLVSAVEQHRIIYESVRFDHGCQLKWIALLVDVAIRIIAAIDSRTARLTFDSHGGTVAVDHKIHTFDFDDRSRRAGYKFFTAAIHSSVAAQAKRRVESARPLPFASRGPTLKPRR